MHAKAGGCLHLRERMPRNAQHMAHPERIDAVHVQDDLGPSKDVGALVGEVEGEVPHEPVLARAGPGRRGREASDKRMQSQWSQLGARGPRPTWTRGSRPVPPESPRPPARTAGASPPRAPSDTAYEVIRSTSSPRGLLGPSWPGQGPVAPVHLAVRVCAPFEVGRFNLARDYHREGRDFAHGGS